jgi:hypothetical protein
VFDHHPDTDRGIVCFITASGFVDGQGFERMRDYLRRRADTIYVIDCSPEGHQPPIRSRIFQGVQQPVCITIAIRDGSTSPETPAPVWFRRLAAGAREDKFNQLAAITLAGEGWTRCPEDWRAPFLPAGGRTWSSYPALDDLLYWGGTGIMSGRAWIVAPDKPTLHSRWATLVGAQTEDKPELFLEAKEGHRIHTVVSDALPGFLANCTPIGEETGPCPEPVRIGYRSFDRQWIIPDKRLINRPNATLWAVRSDQQVYLTVLLQEIPTSGPAVTFTAHIPDVHHYKGIFGGRAYPLIGFGSSCTGGALNESPSIMKYSSDPGSASVAHGGQYGSVVCSSAGSAAASASGGLSSVCSCPGITRSRSLMSSGISGRSRRFSVGSFTVFPFPMRRAAD